MTGLASVWLIAFPLLAAFTAWLAMPIIGTTARGIARAAARPLVAALVMAAAVLTVDRLTMLTAPAPRLALLVSVGALVYGALIVLIARPLVAEVWRLVRRR